jgi:hypothetical protein
MAGHVIVSMLLTSCGVAFMLRRNMLVDWFIYHESNEEAGEYFGDYSICLWSTTTFSHAGGNDEKEDRILAYTHAGGPTYNKKKSRGTILAIGMDDHDRKHYLKYHSL